MSWTVWCDGSGTTGGPGGIGFTAKKHDGKILEGSLPLPNATNQQAELLAAAYALAQIPAGQTVTVFSDSEYLVSGYAKVYGWRARGWRRDRGAVANVRHWERLLAAVRLHRQVSMHWVRGHADCEENERADKLAGAARAEAKRTAGLAA